MNFENRPHSRAPPCSTAAPSRGAANQLKKGGCTVNTLQFSTMSTMTAPVSEIVVVADGQATPPKKLPYHTNHATSQWNLDQVYEAFNQILYCSFDYIPGKGKKDETKKTKITILNAHVIEGVLFYWDEAAKLISAKCPAFRDTKPKATSISGVTLRGMWEKKIEYRIKQRSSWGKGPNAFHETGSGDFVLDGFEGSRDLAFERAFVCAQIDDILDTHLMNLSTQEQRRRDGDNAGAVGGDHALSGVNAQALVLFQSGPNQTAFGKPMMPPAKDGDVANASLKRLNQQIGGAVTKRRNSKDDHVDKTLQFGNSVMTLGDKMAAAIQPPTLEALAERSKASAVAYASVFKEAVVEGIREWRSAPAKSTKLLSMTASDVVTKIKEIGTMFSANTTFEAQLLSSGMNGATLSCMSDIDLKEFFEKQCMFQSYQAAILVASIKSWQL